VRNDFLVLAAVAIQIIMVAARLETLRELRSSCSSISSAPGWSFSRPTSALRPAFRAVPATMDHGDSRHPHLQVGGWHPVVSIAKLGSWFALMTIWVVLVASVCPPRQPDELLELIART
jgi:hypothetical protein